MPVKGCTAKTASLLSGVATPTFGTRLRPDLRCIKGYRRNRRPTSNRGLGGLWGMGESTLGFPGSPPLSRLRILRRATQWARARSSV